MSAHNLPLARLIVGKTNAPRLVVAHGLMSCALAQSCAITHWAQAGYQVVALDARGHGLSPRWDAAQLKQAGDVLVADLVQALKDLDATAPVDEKTTGAQLPVLIGHSLGAATAMVTVLKYPQLVAGVVLCDPAQYGTRSAAELKARGLARKRLLRRQQENVGVAVLHALTAAHMPAAQALANVWAALHVDASLLDTGVVAPSVPWLDALAKISVPTLLITGDKPNSARVGESGLAQVQSLKRQHITTALVPGAGHDLWRTHSVQFYAAVDPWLQQIFNRQKSA